MRYVEQYGALWKLTEAKFQELKRLVESGQEYDLDTMGTNVCNIIYHPMKEAEYALQRRANEAEDETNDFVANAVAHHVRVRNSQRRNSR